MAQFAICAESLGKTFGEVQAVRGIDLQIEKGSIFALLGPNGAGKTTTVRMLAGVLRPTQGKAEVAGQDIAAQTEMVRQKVGVMTETAANYERLSAQQNLEIFGQLYGQSRSEASRRAKQLLALLGLEQRANSKVETFSTGMKKRVLLARALIHEPEVLFLDEPTSGLDPAAAEQVLGIIRDLCAERKHTVLLCTHNLDEAQRLCDRIAVVKQGQILDSGTVLELAGRLWNGLQVIVELERRDAAADLVMKSFSQGPVYWQEATATMTMSGRQVIPELVAGLVKANVRVAAVYPKERTLREIYFKLMGGEEHALESR